MAHLRAERFGYEWHPGEQVSYWSFWSPLLQKASRALAQFVYHQKAMTHKFYLYIISYIAC
jgi:hypothetical protein